jgi:hypothetical protein
LGAAIATRWDVPNARSAIDPISAGRKPAPPYPGTPGFARQGPSAVEQVGIAILEVLPDGTGRGEPVESVEVADRGDFVELLGVWLDRDPDFFAGVGG